MHTRASNKALLLISLALGIFGAERRQGYPSSSHLNVPLTAARLRSHGGSHGGSRSGVSQRSGSEYGVDGEKVWEGISLGGKRDQPDRSGHGHELTADGTSYVHDKSFIKIGTDGKDETAAHAKVHDHLWAHRHAQALLRGEQIHDEYGSKNLSYGTHAQFQEELQNSVKTSVAAEHDKADQLRKDRDDREEESLCKLYSDVKKIDGEEEGVEELRLAPWLKLAKQETLDKLGEFVKYGDEQVWNEERKVIEDRKVWKPKALTRAQFTEIFGNTRKAVDDIDEYEFLLASGEIGTVFNADFSKKAVYDNPLAEPVDEFFWRRARAVFEVSRPRAKTNIAHHIDPIVAKKMIEAQRHEDRKLDMKMSAAAASGHVEVRMIELEGDDKAYPTTHSHFMQEVRKQKIVESKWADAKDTPLEPKNRQQAMDAGKAREVAYNAKRDEAKNKTADKNQLVRAKESIDRLNVALKHATETKTRLDAQIARAGETDALNAKLRKAEDTIRQLQAKIAQAQAVVDEAAPAPVAPAPEAPVVP